MRQKALASTARPMLIRPKALEYHAALSRGCSPAFEGHRACALVGGLVGDSQEMLMR